MDIVVDTNIILATVLDEPEKEAIIHRTRGLRAVAPLVLPFELGNALAAMVRRQRLTPEQALAAYEATRRIPIRLIDVDIGRALELATSHGIYAYDAYFLQCARQRELTLLTLDRQMKNIAREIAIPLMEVQT